MAQYTTHHIPIPSCFVKRALLETLENYILQKATDLEYAGHGRSDRTYTVMIEDSGGTLTLHSVRDIGMGILPNSTKEIRLSLYCIGASGRYLEAKILFATNAHFSPWDLPSSYIEISFHGTSAREITHAMVQELQHQIEVYRNKNLIRKPSISVAVVAFAFALVLLFLGGGLLATKDNVHFGLAMVFFGLCNVAFLVTGWFLPHCIFETMDNERILDKSKWFWRAIATFVVFTVAWGFLSRYLFGPH